MTRAATIADLYRVDGKAELVNGKIIERPPTGFLPGYAADEIFSSLRLHALQTRAGYATRSHAAYLVELPNRKSFSPDASFHKGTHSGMKFLEGAPWFAVEVRSEHDYTAKAEKAIAAKIRDYLAAGTQVVWDVDVLALEVVRMYSVAQPAKPLIFARGMVAHAEPALPGWNMPVEEMFPYFVPYQPEES